MRWYVNGRSEEAVLLTSKYPEDEKAPKMVNPTSHSFNSQSKAQTTARRAPPAASRAKRCTGKDHASARQHLRPRHTQDRHGGTGTRRRRWRDNDGRELGINVLLSSGVVFVKGAEQCCHPTSLLMSFAFIGGLLPSPVGSLLIQPDDANWTVDCPTCLNRPFHLQRAHIHDIRNLLAVIVSLRPIKKTMHCAKRCLLRNTAMGAPTKTSIFAFHPYEVG